MRDISDEQVLKTLEDVFLRLRQIKQYVADQRQLMVDKYPNEIHGYCALNYLYKHMLGFVKDEDIE